MDQQFSRSEEGYSQEQEKNRFSFSPLPHFLPHFYSQAHSFWSDASLDAEEMNHQQSDIASGRKETEQKNNDSYIKTYPEEDSSKHFHQTKNRSPREMYEFRKQFPLQQQQHQRKEILSEQNYSLRDRESISSEQDQEDEYQEESLSHHVDYKRPKRGQRFLNRDIKQILNKENLWKKQMRWKSTWNSFQNFCFFYSKVYSKNRYTQKQTIQTLVTFLTFGQEENQHQQAEEVKVVEQFCTHLEKEACRISKMIRKRSLPYPLWQKLDERRWDDIQPDEWPKIEEELVKALIKENKGKTRNISQRRAREWCIKIRQKFWTSFSEVQFSIQSQSFRNWMISRKQELKKIARKRQRDDRTGNLKCYSKYVDLFLDNLQQNRSIRYNQIQKE